MDWNECKTNKLVKEIKIDKNLVNSLVEASSNKLYTNNLIVLEDFTATSKITLLYDALRELLEALAVLKGYKIYNHECYSAFLKEILQEPNLGNKFDNIRKLRNAINYYGKKISAKEAENILNDILLLTEKIKNKYFS